MIDEKKEICLFIIWMNARNKEAEIKALIAEKFTILKEYNITWSPEKFGQNLSSFYVDDFVGDRHQEMTRGNGEFTVIIAEDHNPLYEKRATQKGSIFVNINSFDLKHKIRKDILNGSFAFHATDDLSQVKKDICLLTGKSLSDLIKAGEFDGKTSTLSRDLPGVTGWGSLEQVFYVLNETCNYVVLRNFHLLPNDFRVDEHGDIDILVDDLQNLIAVLKADNGLKHNAFEFYNYIVVNNIYILFHTKFTGDGYYPQIMQEKLLQTKILNDKGIFIPNDEMYFYALLYHSICHKEKISDTYIPIFKEMTEKLKIEFKTEKIWIKNLLKNYMKSINADFSFLVDRPSAFQAKNVDKSMIEAKNKYLLYQNYYGTSIFDIRLIAINPVFATFLARFWTPFVDFCRHLYDEDAPELIPYKKHLHNRMFFYIRKRWGNIMMASGRVSSGGKLTIEKKILHTGEKQHDFMVDLIPQKKQTFFEGTPLVNILRSNPSEASVKYHFEVFFGEIFRQFSTNTSMLNRYAFDLIPPNCIITPDGKYRFIDFEYKAKENVDKSLIVYKSLLYAGISLPNIADLYHYFCDKFNLDKKFAWCEYYHHSLFLKHIYDVPNPVKRTFLRRVISKLLCMVMQNRKEQIRNVIFANRNYHIFRKYFGEAYIK